jgi:hypothetical protein
MPKRAATLAASVKILPWKCRSRIDVAGFGRQSSVHLKPLPGSWLFVVIHPRYQTGERASAIYSLILGLARFRKFPLSVESDEPDCRESMFLI